MNYLVKNKTVKRKHNHHTRHLKQEKRLLKEVSDLSVIIYFACISAGVLTLFQLFILK